MSEVSSRACRDEVERQLEAARTDAASVKMQLAMETKSSDLSKEQLARVTAELATARQQLEEARSLLSAKSEGLARAEAQLEAAKSAVEVRRVRGVSRRRCFVCANDCDMLGWTVDGVSCAGERGESACER